MLGKNTDLISISSLDKQDFERVLEKARDFEEGERSDCESICRNKIMASLFFEASTRTRLSFESAMHRLGGSVIGFSGIEGTSLVKGETLEDTIRMVDGYADLIIIRHSREGSAETAARVAEHPVINAGDGANEHPTQALLDLHTIKKEFKEINGLRIALVGDLKHGRTTRSLALALNHYNVSLKLISPRELELSSEIKKRIKNNFVESSELNLSDCDVIYVTRIQKERFADSQEYEKLKGTYVINNSVLKNLKNEAIIMHPLPRVDEIATEVDSSKHARYFQQARNGVFVRMALIDLILNG